MRPSAETDTVFGDRLSLVVVAAIAAVLVRSCVVDGEAIIDPANGNGLSIVDPRATW